MPEAGTKATADWLSCLLKAKACPRARRISINLSFEQARAISPIEDGTTMTDRRKRTTMTD